MSTAELTGRHDRRVRELGAWADDPSAVLALNSGTSTFRAPDLPGFLAYRPCGRWLVQIGGAYAPSESRLALLARFRDLAHQRGHRVLALQVQRRDAQALASLGCTVNQLGASYAMPVADFTLAGKPFVKLRNKISRARRAGVQVEFTRADLLPDTDAAALALVDEGWLGAKGRFARPLRTLVGEVAGPAASLRRLALARLDDRVVGYVSLSPVFGTRPGWLHDLSRRTADAPPGVMELLVSQCLQRTAEEGSSWWHFGMTPFTSLDARHRLPGASPLVDRIVRLVAERGDAVYPAASQLEYKRKWGELQTLPDYLAFDGRVSVRGVYRLLKVTNLV